VIPSHPQEVTACQLCGSGNLTVILDMGDQPLSERHDDPRRYPLRLIECGRCTLVQLDHIVDQREVFPPDHPYATGNTGALRQHFAKLAHDLTPLLGPGDLIVDIGSNDGTLLAEFSGAFNRVGVEPTDQAFKCVGKDIRVCRDFFTADAAEHLRALFGPAKLITACNVFAHVPDPHDFLEGVRLLLADDGVFVVETHDVASITEGLQIDTIYHEHLRYYSVATLSRLLAMHGLTVTQAEPVATHGGSIRAYARKTRGDLGKRANQAAVSLWKLLCEVTAAGSHVYGVGATTRATPLIHYAAIREFITCVCEVSSSAKIGLNMPGTAIPIVDESRLIEDQPEFAILFAWHLADSLAPKLRAMGYEGRFIIPLPEPRIVTD